MNIKRVGIILKKGSEEARILGEELSVWLAKRSIDSTIDTITPDLDMLLILGGDGTLLHVAYRASQLGIPVAGINLGDLGFLTEIAISERVESLEAILEGKVVIEERMMLKTRCHFGDAESKWRSALNDVVITKGNMDQMVQLSAWADDEFITTYKADGLIFSTPTGSTAYNLSAGGPIIHPGLGSILVTPICPFMLESRSVILPADKRLRTKVAGMAETVNVVVDGRIEWDMRETDTLEVLAYENPLRLICSPQKGYFDILRNKLNWGGRSGS